MLDEREMSALRTPKGSTGIGQAEIEAHATYDKDQIELARTGKKQVLKVGFGPKTSAGFKYSVLIQSQRNFGFMSMLGFSCTLMATWEGVLV